MSSRALALAAASLALAACRAAAERAALSQGRTATSRRSSATPSRPRMRATALGEAEEVMELAGVKPGMSVADVGAGEGYYTVRLAPRGRRARAGCWPRTSCPRSAIALSDRVQRESLDNVAVKLGTPDNPMLPAQSFDRVFLVHMYHEVQSPYAFLWHLRDGVKPDGLVVVVDSNRPVKRHGIPPAQLKCEFAALGMEPVKFSVLTGGDVYLMAFRLAGAKPAPGQIKAVQRLEPADPPEAVVEPDADRDDDSKDNEIAVSLRGARACSGSSCRRFRRSRSARRGSRPRRRAGG